MATEIEAKMKVDDLASVRERLIQKNARRKRKDLETNSFFDTPDGALLNKGFGLRIRVATDETGAARCIITMKGPLEKGEFKTRQETEFTASDPQAVQAIFETLGFKLNLSFQKRRESWDFQECEVELDELPLLGNYVEIEGPSEASVTAARKELQLDSLPLISTGYVSMLARYVKERGITDPHIHF